MKKGCVTIGSTHNIKEKYLSARDLLGPSVKGIYIETNQCIEHKNKIHNELKSYNEEGNIFNISSLKAINIVKNICGDPRYEHCENLTEVDCFPNDQPAIKIIPLEPFIGNPKNLLLIKIENFLSQIKYLDASIAIQILINLNQQITEKIDAHLKPSQNILNIQNLIPNSHFLSIIRYKNHPTKAEYYDKWLDNLKREFINNCACPEVVKMLNEVFSNYSLPKN